MIDNNRSNNNFNINSSSKKVMIIGSGGREHAFAYKLAQSPYVDKVYWVNGNCGAYFNDKIEVINLTIEKENYFKDLTNFAKEKNVYLTVVGPENPLIDGIVDSFKAKGLKIFGPDKKASLLEGSKIFAKNFCIKYGINTANFKEFYDYHKAINFLNSLKSFPVVIKADGPAAGKGVIIAENIEEAKKTVENFFIDKIFGEAGEKIVIEEYLKGYEVSVLAFVDKNGYKLFKSSMDHKKIGNNDTGLNTGGMGVVAPIDKFESEVYDNFVNMILNPTLEGFKSEGIEYRGILYFGLMISNKIPYLLEYNVRGGDPEIQTLLPLLKTDLFEIMDSIINDNLNNIKIQWENKYSCCIVCASSGYPLSYKKGYEIKINFDDFSNLGGKHDNCFLFFAGARKEGAKLLTNGGRVLSVVCLADSLKDAIKLAYKKLESIKFENMYYRNDIGYKVLKLNEAV